MIALTPALRDVVFARLLELHAKSMRCQIAVAAINPPQSDDQNEALATAKHNEQLAKEGLELAISLYSEIFEVETINALSNTANKYASMSIVWSTELRWLAGAIERYAEPAAHNFNL